MTSRVIRRNSIRRRLLLFLIPSLLLLVVGAAALTYYVALHVATFAYDRSLLDPALDMAANVRMEPEGPRLAMLKQAQEALLYDHPTPVEIAPAIEALNRLLAQLRESNEMQQRFLANAAHQLRTPLAGLQMHLELLLRRDLSPEVREEIAGMHVATVRAGHLANQLLALAKAEASMDDSGRLATVDLHGVADHVVQEWVQRAIARDIDLGFVLEHATVAGNAALLGELLDNLLDNALRYTPRGGSVTVRCGSELGSPYLSVEDNGPGIPESAHGRVFERFYRIQGTPGDGAGLGLAIVKEVALRHHGALRIERPNGNDNGEGTRIVIRFPAAAPEST